MGTIIVIIQTKLLTPLGNITKRQPLWVTITQILNFQLISFKLFEVSNPYVIYKASIRNETTLLAQPHK